MAMSPYLAGLRAVVGHDLLILPAVTGIVFDDDRRILLVHERSLEIWSTPGGAIDPGEHPADAVVRELWEETGLFTEPVRLLGVHSGDENVVTYPNGDRSAYVALVFECVVRGGRLRGESEETRGARFMSAGDLHRYPSSRWARYLLPRLLEGRSRSEGRSPSDRRLRLQSDESSSPFFEPATWRPQDL